MRPGGITGARSPAWREPEPTAIVELVRTERSSAPGEEAAVKRIAGAGTSAGCGERVRCGRGRATRTVLKLEAAAGAEAIMRASAEGSRLPRLGAVAQPYSRRSPPPSRTTSASAEPSGERSPAAVDGPRRLWGWAVGAGRGEGRDGRSAPHGVCANRVRAALWAGRRAEPREASRPGRPRALRCPPTQPLAGPAHNNVGPAKCAAGPGLELNKTARASSGRRPRRSSPPSMRSVGPRPPRRRRPRHSQPSR
jgi:hypothetical protein